MRLLRGLANLGRRADEHGNDQALVPRFKGADNRGVVTRVHDRSANRRKFLRGGYKLPVTHAGFVLLGEAKRALQVHWLQDRHGMKGMLPSSRQVYRTSANDV